MVSLAFALSAAGLLVAVPIHWASVSRGALGEALGAGRGEGAARLLGTFSGALETVCLAGLWLAPQPRWGPGLLPGPVVEPVGLPLNLVQVLVPLPLLAAGAFLGIRGVMDVGLEVADTHRVPDRLVTTGVYGTVRHPQYLGWTLAHVALSIALSATWALLFTPALLFVIFCISWAEEGDLVRAYGDEYREYRDRVPMLVPRL